MTPTANSRMQGPLLMKKLSHLHHRGSVIAVTLIIALALSIIVASFISLGTSAVKTTEASFSHHAVGVVAEEGLDRATSALQSYMEVLRRGSPLLLKDQQTLADGVLSGSGWAKTSRDGYRNVWSLKLNGGKDIGLGNGRTAKVVVELLNLPTWDFPDLLPMAVSDARYDASSTTGSKYTRQLAAYFRMANPFGYGMVIPYVPGGDPRYNRFNANGRTISISSYDEFNAFRSRVTLATSRATDGALSGNLIIFGHVATGGDDPTDNMRGAHVYDENSSADYKIAGVDPNCVTWDFDADIPLLNSPVTYEQIQSDGGLISLSGPLPSGVVLKDGLLTIAGSTDPEKPSYFALNESLSIGGAAVTTVEVRGYVVLVVGTTSSQKVKASLNPLIKISGSGGLMVGDGATPSGLYIYTTGNMDVTGQGILNSNTGDSAQSLRIFGTNRTGAASLTAQSFNLAGNANFTGLLYAPLADVKLSGGGSSGVFNGAIIAANVTANGAVKFRYDERLRLLFIPIPELAYWVELKGEKKLPFAE